MRACLTLLMSCLALPGAAQTPDADAFWEAQLARIDADVARIAQHSQPGAQVYFVGFAGFGEERVFAEEIALAATRIGARYGSQDLALRLVNDRRDLQAFPLATARSLSYALHALAKVMDEDDVLFLALSSHGYRQGALSVNNTGMKDSALGAEMLAGMFRDAGIRWRVVVVSACYSGKFIEPLADNRSIVITASRADRTSFGCSDTRDLTYFGEAFYRDALPVTQTLRAAFDVTRRQIGKLERQERIKASQPQAYFGPFMESKLDEIEANVRVKKGADAGS